jgi:DNA-binding FadR family transcriptional regulator
MECIMTTEPQQKFDPAYVATLRELLEIAMEEIAAQNRTPATKAKMAQVIVQNAALGITDAHDLLSRAVHAGVERAP